MRKILFLLSVITYTWVASASPGGVSCDPPKCENGYHVDNNAKPCPACVPDNCKPNEIYNPCGSACPDTCENCHKKDRVCTLQCVPGCFCKPGLVRDSNNNCIDPKDCGKDGRPCPQIRCKKGYHIDNNAKPCPKCVPDNCKPNEVYDDCGSSCPDTCDNFNDKDRFCTLQCVSGCFCKAGLVRNSDGNCIDPKDCCGKETCGKNEHYNACGTSCPLTCDNFLDPPKICNFLCKVGCECDDGYVRSPDGRCVMPWDCPNNPVQCGPNAHYSNCASPCPPMCQESKIPRACPAVCVKGCVCDDGYILYSKNGPCVPKIFCPNKICGINEHYTTCGTASPLTCDNYRDPPKTCKIGCECDEGYVRSSDGRCVKPRDCPTKPNSFCPVRTSKVCIRNQNQCCTDLDCKPNERCCKENCGYECRTAVNAPTAGEPAYEPGCKIG